MNFTTTENATATATAKNNQRWPGITSAPSARRPSLVLNMSLDICDPVSHSATAPPAPLTSHQIPAIAHTSVSIVETSSPEGLSSLHLPSPAAPLILISSLVSDLLSRHVNKCHPNEKPLVSSTPSRRKGTSSTSRATTSKQACDQCVQSTLPCDGANPCCQ
jgi:hypothetical protein